MKARGGPGIAVIVSTYERPDALDAVLRSLAEQTYRAFEVVVADDGSGPDTRELVAGHAKTSGLDLRHVRQEDRGYRLAAIRNRAAAATGQPYLIFLDGDCLVRPDYVERHAGLAEPGHFVHGSRVRLDPGLSRTAIEQGPGIERRGAIRWLAEWLRGRADRFTPLLRVPLGPLRRMTPRRWHGVKGCNLALWRSDFLAVNGFDEGFEGWGFEDNDLVVRLIRNGVRRKEGRYAVPVLHLWHKSRPPDPASRERFERRLRSDTIRAERGIDG
ncbi:MAG: glycosyltransferase [Gemmatimonadota bacterium]|uniref:glycosyltransferase n=1 Tax=Candidatus Palauibacter scopulicola TaxID=3056741 RepID=UPI0023A3061A|nr:glycosyltransferase [Candidatus Palauibacter scopulicola]MDE2664360.1 glycosyltransferase [Candidatus Palauibacter scopulicola]